MLHLEVEAIASIAHYSQISSKKPHIFANMMVLYNGHVQTAPIQIMPQNRIANIDSFLQGKLVIKASPK